MPCSVAPSRHDAGFSCYDHFLEAYTRSGEPLGYKGAALKVLPVIYAALTGPWRPACAATVCCQMLLGTPNFDTRQWLGGMLLQISSYAYYKPCALNCMHQSLHEVTGWTCMQCNS